MKKIEDKFQGKYEAFRNVNLTDFNKDSSYGKDSLAYAFLAYALRETKDPGVRIKNPVQAMSFEEWEMLKYAQWLITQHKLNKADKKALAGYGEGKRILDDVLSGRYAEELEEQKASQEAEEKARKERESGIIQLSL